ncbi:hypothetical protein EV127DRAFT_62871 [Xylaria flabelliformis]|nr:hypothetical protein EV127DRAFT_62871 [Xylaria flabelliformis]
MSSIYWFPSLYLNFASGAGSFLAFRRLAHIIITPCCVYSLSFSLWLGIFSRSVLPSPSIRSLKRLEPPETLAVTLSS